MRGAALVARDAAVEWLCLPRFDSAPVFLALLDQGRGGACTVALRGGAARTRRRYLPSTNILETTLEGADGGSVAVIPAPGDQFGLIGLGHQ
jgi:GH15 family glucan-1,4-alpha-glucosidase